MTLSLRLASVYKKKENFHELIEVYETANMMKNDHIRLSFLAQAYLLDGESEKKQLKQ